MLVRTVMLDSNARTVMLVSSGGSRGVPRVPWNPPFQTTQLNIRLTYKYLFSSMKKTRYY